MRLHQIGNLVACRLFVREFDTPEQAAAFIRRFNQITTAEPTQTTTADAPPAEARRGLWQRLNKQLQEV